MLHWNTFNILFRSQTTPSKSKDKVNISSMVLDNGCISRYSNGYIMDFHGNAAALRAINMKLDSIEKTALAAIKPWSHTDRRQIVTLLESAPDTQEGRKRIECDLKSSGPASLMVRLGTVPEIWDADDRGQVSSPARFFVVAWSKKSPNRISILSRPMANLWNAQDWATCGVEPKSHETVLTMEVLAEGEFSLSPRR
jgi:hypothetical protein